MCVVSMIGDHYHDKWKWVEPIINPNQYIPNYNISVGISREEFEQLKKEVLEMKELLKRAVKYDIENNEPNCK